MFNVRYLVSLTNIKEIYMIKTYLFSWLTVLGYEIDTNSLSFAGFAVYILLVLVNLAHSIIKVRCLNLWHISLMQNINQIHFSNRY